MQWALSVQSYGEEAGEVASPQPAIAEGKQAWIDEATRMGMVQGPKDVAGLQQLKRLLGDTYTNLFVGCNTEALRLEGPKAIRERGNGEQAA